MEIESLSQKQILSYTQSNSRINIWEGAVRSGKSFASILRFIKFIRYGPPGDAAIVGKTDRTIKRNVIVPMQEMLGTDLRYKAGIGEVKIWGRTIYVIGANDDRAEGKIRGATFAGVLVDEVTLIPENFFRMLLSRLSIAGAQLFGTTNPDSPFHWLKKDFIDRQDLDLSVFSFTLDDNPSLEPLYVEALKREYTGLWRDRYIDGKWTLAEGTVFDMFDTNLHVIDTIPGLADYYVVGVDYGTRNPTAFCMIGYSSRTYPNMWLEKEYYWDSNREIRQKTDSEYAEDLVRFCDGKNVQGLYVDPSAASFKLELLRSGLSPMDADNEALDGIRFHASLLSNGTFKICRNCTHAIGEYGCYRWNSTAQRRGEDKPIKEHDHMMDALRYALFTHFWKRGGVSMRAEDVDRLRNEAWGIQSHGGFFDNAQTISPSFPVF